jgi:hypothetical protein
MESYTPSNNDIIDTTAFSGKDNRTWIRLENKGQAAGAPEASGPEVESFNLHGMNIKPCLPC